MNTESVDYQNVQYIECLPGGGLLDSEAGAVDLVSICGEAGTHNLVIHGEALSPDFFDLKTGLAGVILLKFSNYHLRTALIAHSSAVNQGRFREMVLETNRGNQFRVFLAKEDAVNWLMSPHPNASL